MQEKLLVLQNFFIISITKSVLTIYIRKKYDIIVCEITKIKERLMDNRQTAGQNSGKKAVKTIGLMAVIILLAKFMGLFRETLVANIYGQGMESDILNTSTQIPLLFFDMVLGAAILSTFVPIFNKYLQEDGKAAAMSFANNFVTIVGSVAVAAALIGVVFAEPIVHIMTPGYADVPGKLELTACLLRILFPSVAFTAVAYISVGILQSFGEFTIPSLISVVSNGVMILYLMLCGNRLGLTGVAVSMLIAWALQLLIQIPWLKKFGFSYRFRFDLKDKGIRSAAAMAVPVLISSWLQPLCSVINMSFGSGLGDGAVSALNWANKIYIIMVGVFAYAITNFIFPKLSRLGGDNGNEGFVKITRMSVGWILFIIIPVSALFLALSPGVIRVVFERGAFTADSTAITAEALFYYSFGMAGYAVCEVLNKSFYAIQDGKTPMFTSAIGIAVNLAGAFLFTSVFKMGVGGLALAAAVSSLVIAVCLMIMINRRRRGIINKEFLINILKTVICGCGAFLTAKLIYPLTAAMGSGTIITLVRLCIAALPAMAVYAAAAYLLRVTEIYGCIKFISKRQGEQ